MHGDLRSTHQHLGLQFLGEQALVADFRQGHIQDFVALSGHGLHRDRQAWVGFLQFGFHPVGLHHGQLAAAGGDAQLLESHGHVETAIQPTESKAQFRSRFHRMQARGRF